MPNFRAGSMAAPGAGSSRDFPDIVEGELCRASSVHAANGRRLKCWSVGLNPVIAGLNAGLNDRFM